MTPTDQQAIERYRYMLRTAPPEDIERAHEEAFAALSPEQRRQVLAGLAQVVAPSEIRGDDPASLARTATRAELRQPGTLERTFSTGPGLGSWFLSSFAGAFIGTAIAQSFLGPDIVVADGASGATDAEGRSAGAGEGAGEGAGDTGAEGGWDGGGDFGSDGGGDFGDFGGF